MLAKPRFPEIDHRTMKLIVGIIALSLPIVTNYLASLDGAFLTSISESYWRGGWPQTILVGFLFAIASFLVAYNGQSSTEMLLSKVAAGAALGVAMFPCGCNGKPQIIPGLHYAAAGVMFGVLAYFCWLFLLRARAKKHREANLRAAIYAACGIAIGLCILALLFNGMTHDSVVAHFPDFVFWGEAGGLWAFAISWLTASHVFPGITRSDERFPLVRHHAGELAEESLRPQG